jgi:hypothetical protein
MFKIATIAALVALISACSSMPAGSMAGNSGMSRTTLVAPGAGLAKGPNFPGGAAGGPN